MKNLWIIIALLIGFTWISIPCYAFVPDSTAANIVGEVAGGIYNYYAPSLPTWLTQIIIGLISVGVPMLLKFYADLKADPTKSTSSIAQWARFILDTLTWFVKETQPKPQADQPESVKKN